MTRNRKFIIDSRDHCKSRFPVAVICLFEEYASTVIKPNKPICRLLRGCRPDDYAIEALLLYEWPSFLATYVRVLNTPASLKWFYVRITD